MTLSTACTVVGTVVDTKAPADARSRTRCPAWLAVPVCTLLCPRGSLYNTPTYHLRGALGVGVRPGAGSAGHSWGHGAARRKPGARAPAATLPVWVAAGHGAPLRGLTPAQTRSILSMGQRDGTTGRNPTFGVQDVLTAPAPTSTHGGQARVPCSRDASQQCLTPDPLSKAAASCGWETSRGTKTPHPSLSAMGT